jgi:molybdopterin-containing oxidoreductase family iron-sulfur binding subunit
MEKYWRSLEEKKGGPIKDQEAHHEAEHKNAVLALGDEKLGGTTASRRDFLKLVGFSFATAAITSSCEKPVQKAIPYLIKPEEITPGKANYYATSFFDGNEYCSVVAKVRDGRPIKIEANKQSAVSKGGTSARVQASVLNLYDEARFRDPMKGRKKIDWETLDAAVSAALEKQTTGRKVLLTSTIISPSTKALIKQFTETYPDVEWVQYDEISTYAIRSAHQKLMGKSIIPGYQFQKAEYILSFDADFLGTWLSPVTFARGYAKNRKINSKHRQLSKHVQIESGMSLTGSNADERIPVTPAKGKAILGAIYNQLAVSTPFAPLSGVECDMDISTIASELMANKGKSLVVCGSNDPEMQEMTAGINMMLDNYGKTIDTARTMHICAGDDRAFSKLTTDLAEGNVSVLLTHNVNPVFSSQQSEVFKKGMEAAELTVFIGSAFCETAKASAYVAADHHYLEAWGDAEPVTKSFSLQQPCIRPIYNTRAMQDSLLKWMGSNQSYDEFLKNYWESDIYPEANVAMGFTPWWKQTLQAGVFELEAGPQSVKAVPGFTPGYTAPSGNTGFQLVLYPPVGLVDGRHANNPWLQELPDPVSKVCWDNYLAVSVADAEELGLEDEMVVTLSGMQLPVLIQPGQAKGTMALALGYGRTVAGKVGDNVGVNAFPLVDGSTGVRQYTMGGMTIEKTGETYPLARTQTHHVMEGRPIVRETTLEEYKVDPYAGNHFHVEAEKHHTSLYPETKYDGYHWGLAVDLNKCVGCNNCVVSCIAENNIATVGKEEVRNRRIMHWMRLDRYFSEDPENPKVYHQPVMCQHCDNAPCENVCPVSATMHSNEGLNQVAYVRCIGTKYCINNCPYRVRRFNWFKYVNNDEFNFHLNSDVSKLVLNPDVTIRSRGVVEKCSFCVQRIQEVKLQAKLENRTIEDGEVQPACVQSCPTGALVFGNMDDKESEVAQLMEEERNYHLLEQLHTLPSVGYLTKVRNVEPEPGAIDALKNKKKHAGDHEAGHHS